MEKSYERKFREFSDLVLAYADAIIDGKDAFDEYCDIMMAFREALKGEGNEKEES